MLEVSEEVLEDVLEESAGLLAAGLDSLELGVDEELGAPELLEPPLLRESVM